MFDFSATFNTIQPALLKNKLEDAGLHKSMVSWLMDFLSNRPQYVRMQDCVSQVVLCNTGVPQGTVLAPFLYIRLSVQLTQTAISRNFQMILQLLAV